MRSLHSLAQQRARRLCGRFGLPAQSIVEFAVFLPLILVFALCCIQFAIVFIAYINVLNVTRDAARWVSIHPHVVDGSYTAGSPPTLVGTIGTVKNRTPAGLNKSSLTLAFSPACASLTSGKCSGRDPGVQIGATSTYSLSSHIFLPTTLGWGAWQIALPTSSTTVTYTIYMQVEPN